MKILLVADIHANWFALSAIRERFDVCLCLGDIVEYGTDPVPCIDWVRRHAHAAVRGNHDHATAQRVPTPLTSGCRRLAAATRAHHARVLQPTHYKFLARLPVTQSLQIDGRTFFLVHATPRDPMDEYLGADPVGWAQRLAGIQADFVCVGHTHLPMELDVDDRKLINPGSVGQPRDGDPRASYVIIEDGVVHFRRIEYDIDAAIAHLRHAGLDDESLAIGVEMLRTGGRSAEAARAT